ncbi:hypothetical protein ECC02_007919 [Trypanosoma cruzi]|uniref:Uncharacterized protein n=1 Tax=Trypanosoma cruzi TaxID=5693 RepID=A0A7J6XXB9_TRYCR|nr:hypothetical protein ECC02_007919 [Trypanosoma cruzi]
MLEGCSGGKGRRAHRVTGGCRCGRTLFLVSTRKSFPEWRHGAQVRCDSCPLLGRPTRAMQITSNPSVSAVPSLPHTEETGPPRPPPKPPPSVSTAPPRRTTSSRSTSPCPSCSSVFSSVHNMKVHARRTNPGTPIVAEGLTCGFCDSSTVSPRSASRAGRHRKFQAYQRAKNGQRNSASSNDSHSPPATPLLQPHQPLSPDNPREALPHMLWECPRPRQLSIRLFGNTTSRTTAPFKTEKLATSPRTARRPLKNSGSKV